MSDEDELYMKMVDINEIYNFLLSTIFIKTRKL